jgi:hypothetical protein
MVKKDILNKIKENIYKEALENATDITHLYYIENVGTRKEKFRICKNNDENINSILIEFITEARLEVTISFSSNINTSVLEFFNKIEEKIIKTLSKFKYNLYKLNFNVVDIE